MRKLELYVRKYGPETGPKYFHALQSQAAHAGVSARLRKKIERLNAEATPATEPERPLFRALEAADAPAPLPSAALPVA